MMERLYDIQVYRKSDPRKQHACTITVSARNMGQAIEYVKCMTPFDIIDPYGIWDEFNPKKKRTKRRSGTMTAPTPTHGNPSA